MLQEGNNMETQFKDTGSILDHCRKCRCLLYIHEEDFALCESCIFDIMDTNKRKSTIEKDIHEPSKKVVR